MLALRDTGAECSRGAADPSGLGAPRVRSSFSTRSLMSSWGGVVLAELLCERDAAVALPDERVNEAKRCLNEDGGVAGLGVESLSGVRNARG